MHMDKYTSLLLVLRRKTKKRGIIIPYSQRAELLSMQECAKVHKVQRVRRIILRPCGMSHDS